MDTRGLNKAIDKVMRDIEDIRDDYAEELDWIAQDDNLFEILNIFAEVYIESNI